MAVVILVAQQLDSMFVTPLVYQQTVNLHPIVTLTAVIVGSQLLGVPRTRVPGRSRRRLPRVGNARETGGRSEGSDTGDTPGRLVGSFGTPA